MVHLGPHLDRSLYGDSRPFLYRNIQVLDHHLHANRTHIKYLSTCAPFKYLHLKAIAVQYTEMQFLVNIRHLIVELFFLNAPRQESFLRLIIHVTDRKKNAINSHTFSRSMKNKDALHSVTLAREPGRVLFRLGCVSVDGDTTIHT